MEHHEEKQRGLVNIMTNGDGAGTFAFVYIILVLGFLVSLLIFG